MRQKRVEFDGAVYHVMQRGNNKEKIFQNEADKRFFVAELANSKKMYGFKLLGFVLLDNHYHLLIQTGVAPLSKIMQRQNSLYSRYYNRVHERTDHLFGLRYKSIIIEDDRYLFAVLRYLHWNPIKAGIVKEIKDYKWSSDTFYRQGRSGLVDTEFIYNIISDSHQIAIKEYLRLIQDCKAQEKYQEIIIEDSSIKDLFDTVIQKKKTMDSILFELGLDDDELDLIKMGSRLRKLKPYKEDFVKKALLQGYTIKEIAEYINISDKAVYKLKEPKLEREMISTK
ncbi:MAG: REP-associated tyrosine transposase [Bacillota bacterium]